ncbi:PDGLE domain-containing protein [Nocardioides sp. HDW12B]|uniref:PDGLE domain-containing protein n=1 Tax=Nocardioides sp. HDW12B TaxID=2714939 RepID=UPI001F0FF345|nr:PDGLE domain-containing protein [Nocardioides sp. HDW12B]
MSRLRGRVPTRLVLAGLLVATLLMAGVVSFYASSAPDGLDRVSQDEGFAATEKEHGSAGSPLSDYTVDGVEDERVSGGLAGVLGVGVVLTLTAGIAYAVRRRPGDASEARTDSPDAVETGAR